MISIRKIPVLILGLYTRRWSLPSGTPSPLSIAVMLIDAPALLRCVPALLRFIPSLLRYAILIVARSPKTLIMVMKKIHRRLEVLLKPSRSADIELALASEELDRVKKALYDVKSSAEAEVESMKQEIGQEKARAAKAETLAEAHATRIHDLEKRRQDDQARAHTTLTQATLEREHIQRLLDDKTTHNNQLLRESSVAQQWLSIRDALTESQIIGEVEGINYEISNIASTFSEALVNALPQGAPFHVDLPLSFHIFFSSEIINVFPSVDHREESALLEVVIQAVLTTFASEVCRRWDIKDGMMQSSLNQIFDVLYRAGMLFKSITMLSWFNQLLSLEVPGISGNWKALTHRYINLSHKTSLDSNDDTLFQNFLSLLVLLASAFNLDGTSAVRLAEDMIGDMLHDLVFSVKKLNVNLAEGITSCILNPILVDPNSPYDASTMKDGTGGCDAESSSETMSVLCTTGLGLQRRMWKNEGVIEEKFLIPPTVALRGFLDFLDVDIRVPPTLEHDTQCDLD
jgi:hypothetical protein